MSGLETAVRASLPGCYVYLFTDAPASDYYKYENVKRIVQEKDCQVVFVINQLSCLHETEESEKFSVYPKLAELTSGQVFYLGALESVSEVLNYVIDSIESRRIILNTATFLRGYHSVTFTADSGTKSVSVCLSKLGSLKGKYYVSVKKVCDEDDDEDGECDTISYEIVNQERSSILKFNTSSPGIYNISFYCNERTNVLIMAGADVDFRHGFSTKTDTSFNDTVFNPIRDAKNVLFIKLFGKNAVLKNVIFLDLNHIDISKMDLELHDEKENVYVSKPFDPPSIKFRISTVISGDNGTITRYGHLVLETEKYEDRKPIIKISGNNLVDYDAELNLQCTVYGYPEPVITWHSVFYDGKVTKRIRKLEAILYPEPPYTYYSKLKEYPKKNTTYQCSAANKLGYVSEMFNVGIKLEPLLKVGQLKSQIVEYGAQAILHCKVECFPPCNISWPLNKKKQILLSKGIIILSSDNSTLTIKEVKKGAGGKYSCRVEQNDNLVVRSAKIGHNGRKPKLTKPVYQTVYGRIGKDAVLTCGKINGYPEPEIKWDRQLYERLTPDFMEVDGSANMTQILIPKANKLNSALYLCTVKNELGEAKKYIHFFLEYEPTVELDLSGTKIVKNGAEVYIKCEVKGMPIPKVEWFKDKTKILKSEFIKIFRDHSLRLTKANVSHSGEYTCKAKNKLSTASQSINITVYKYTLGPPSNTKHVCEEEYPLELNCGLYAYGEPKPSYRWIFENETNTITLSNLDFRSWDPSSIQIKEGLLTIDEVLPEQRGNYTCEFTTIEHVMDTNITFDVDVQFAPTCVDSLEELSHATAVVGDRGLKIICNVTGNPKPTYTWQKSDGVIIKNLAKVKKYEFEDNWLRIRNIEKADQYKYECIAKNNITGCALSRRTVEVHVQNSPPYESIRINELKTIEFSKYVSISCPIRPYVIVGVSWYKDGVFLNSKSNQLIFDSVEPSDSGVYTCRVNRVEPPEFENANITIKVIGPVPVFVAKHTSKIELYSFEEFTLDCSVAEPSSVRNVIWWIDGKEILYKKFIYKSRVNKATEQYTCDVYNAFQKTSRTFSVVMKDFTDCVIKIDNDTMPLISISGHWPNFRTINEFTTIPKLNRIVFTCPNQFTKFTQNQVTAICYGETNFFVQEKRSVFDFTDLQCNEEMHAIAKKIKNKECQGKGTLLYKIMFVVNDGTTIDAIEYCLDRTGETLFAKYIMKSPAGFTPKTTTMWDKTDLTCYESCVSQNSRSCIRSGCSYYAKSNECCFTKRHLVNPKDLFPGPLQRSSYNRLNIVPHWSTRHTENWDEVEQRIRQLRLTATSDNDLVIYSGVAEKTMEDKCGNLLKINNQKVAKYLWKVVQHPGTKSSVAIVQPNVPGLKAKHLPDVIKCRGNICDKVSWMRGFYWANIKKGYIYCCKLKDFISKFNLNDIGFEKSFNSLLINIY